MVGHELGTRGAVEPDPQQVAVSQGGIEGLGILARQQGSHGLDGALHGYRHGALQLGEGPVDALQPGLDVHGILARLQQKDIGAPFHQARRLLMIRCGKLVESDSAGDGDGLGGGAHGARHEPRLVGSAGGFGHLPGEPGRLPVDPAGFVGEVIFCQDYSRGPKGVGFHDVGAGLQIAPVYLGDDVGPCQDQVFVTTLVLRSAEVLWSQALFLDRGAHCPVHNQDASLKQRFQGIDAVCVIHMHCPHVRPQL